MTPLLKVLRQHQTLVFLLALCIVLPLFLFWKIAEDIYKKGGFHGDQVLLEWLHSYTTPFFDTLALTFSHLGGPLSMGVLSALMVLVLLLFRQRRAAVFFLLSLGGAVALNILVKLVVQRQRPDLWLSLAPESDFSFPSGHAMGSAALAAAIISLTWVTRWRWGALILSILFATGVCWSRLYLGVHYPSDILAGVVASVAWVSGLHLLFGTHRLEILSLLFGNPPSHT